MKIIRMDDGKEGDQAAVCALGKFDGFHIGHQALLKEVQRVKKAHRQEGKDLLSSVLLLDSSPGGLLSSNHRGLMSLQDKLDCLRSMDFDQVFIKSFDSDFMHMEPEDFVHEFLIKKMKVAHLVVGRDYSYGAKARGKVEDLLEEEKAGSLQVSVVPDVTFEGSRVSSTRIRSLLSQGELDQANQLLGRPYAIQGQIVHGVGRGHGLGFPTANLEINFPYVLPTAGVYLSQMDFLDDQGRRKAKAYGVTNVGTNPTFTDKDQVFIESYLMDFDRDIYGERVRLHLLAFQRPEVKFSSKEELVDQMVEDEKESRRLLKEILAS